jgi:hypothetical protein
MKMAAEPNRWLLDLAGDVGPDEARHLRRQSRGQTLVHHVKRRAVSAGGKLNAALLILRHGSGETQRPPSEFVVIDHQPEGRRRHNTKTNFAIAHQTEVGHEPDVQILVAGGIRNPKGLGCHVESCRFGQRGGQSAEGAGNTKSFDLDGRAG